MTAVLFRAHRVLSGLAALFLLFALVVIATPASVAWAESPAAAVADEGQITVETKGGPHTFRIEIADDDAERMKGLMFRRTLADDAGMLFDFGNERPVAFWMKNTYVSLDMIFIHADGTIARIAERTTPLSERVVPSRAPVRFVLEVVAGTAERLGIRAGDRVVHPRIAATR